METLKLSEESKRKDSTKKNGVSLGQTAKNY